MSNQNEQLALLLQENRALRTRVAELERASSRFQEGAAASVPRETLSEREGLLVEAERIAHMGSWVWDIGTNQVFWSDELFRILGYEPDRDPPSAEAFFAALHPEDLPRVRAHSEIAATTGVAEHVDCRVLWRDGTIRDTTLSSASLFDSKGVLRRVVGTMLDVTEARRAERETQRALMLLAEAQRIAQVGSWALDIVQGKLEWSAEMRNILGLPSDVHPTEAGFIACVHPGDRERLSSIHARALTEGTGSGQARIVRPDGSVRHVYISSAPGHDAAGRLITLRGTMHDITQRVELEEQLLRAQKLEALGRLSGGVAHDFNNLLTVILANLDLLKRHVDGKALAHVQQIEQASELAAELTRQLLAFGRRAHLEPRITVLNELVTDALAMTRRLIDPNITLNHELAPDLWPIRVDVAHFKQILINLVVNARDALPHGGTITVSTRNRDFRGTAQRPSELEPGEYVELSVSDTGFGMDEATRARIFEPFFTTKREGQGSGLGLAVVFGAVAQHGAAISVDSQLGRGTTFHIYFARAHASVDRPGLLPSTAPTERTAKGQVLLVEDDDNVALVVREVLELGGYDVQVASRPSQAIELWRARTLPFDLLITDVLMPEMRGPQLVAELTRHAVPPRVLFITGYGPELFGKGAEQREYPVLEKPFSTQVLLTTVHKLLSQEPYHQKSKM